MPNPILRRWLLAACLTLASAAAARSKDADDFPDYTHVEYAKPLPPPDQQVPEPPRGSFHLQVGGGEDVESMPQGLELPHPHVMQKASVDPEMSDLFNETTLSSATLAPGTTVPAVAVPAGPVKK